ALSRDLPARALRPPRPCPPPRWPPSFLPLLSWPTPRSAPRPSPRPACPRKVRGRSPRNSVRSSQVDLHIRHSAQFLLALPVGVTHRGSKGPASCNTSVVVDFKQSAAVAVTFPQ